MNKYLLFVIVHEKSVFFASFFFEIPQKWLKLFCVKKLSETMALRSLQKNHRKNYIIRDIKCFVKMSVSMLVHARNAKLLWTL